MSGSAHDAAAERARRAVEAILDASSPATAAELLDELRAFGPAGEAAIAAAGDDPRKAVLLLLSALEGR